MPEEIQRRKSFAAFREEKAIGGLSPALNVMIKAVRKAGRKLMRDFVEIESLQGAKGLPVDFINKAIAKVQETLTDELKAARPDYGFKFADGTVINGKDSSNTFLVNPLDGVVNFAHAIPEFATDITLLRDNDILAGVIYNPVTDELYYTEKGAGAFLMTPRGDRRLRVSGHKDVDNALIGVDFSKQNAAEVKEYQAVMAPIIMKTQGARRFGAVSLGFANVAAGKFDAYWCRFAGPEAVGTGILMVKEAGGHARAENGAEKMLEVLMSGSIIATNDEMDFATTKLIRGKG